MVLENFENIVALLCTIIGLLYCVFRYIETPKSGYRYLVMFFLANFLSEYYWTIYQLVMGDYPNVSVFVAYLGWNISYLVLLIAVYFMRHDGAKRLFHPLMLLPIAVNIPQFLLYIKYGGILNNLWEVSITTAIIVLCIQELLYYANNKEKVKSFPLFFLFTMLYCIMGYGMWTSSCFVSKDDPINPYTLFALIASVLKILIAYGAAKYYDTEEPDSINKTSSELRFQVMIQTIVSLVIIIICVVGAFTAFMIKRSLENEEGVIHSESQLVIYLFAISAALILLIILLIYLLTSRYRRVLESGGNLTEGGRRRASFIFTVIITLVLMSFVVIYNNATLYNASVVSVYEDGEDVIETTSTELENYMSVDATTLKVVADTVDLMNKQGSSSDDILKYLTDQTDLVAEEFDDNFTGLYAYINGDYLDGLGWIPPKEYEPTERDWYQTAIDAGGEVAIVSPYVDAQTGSVVITFAKMLSGDAGKKGRANVVCLDVIVNHIQEVTEHIDIAGKGFGMVVNEDGFIISHRDKENNGKNISKIYDNDLIDQIINVQKGRFTAKINDEECTVFVCPVMNKWYSTIIINNSELFEETYSQLIINVLVSLITFLLITFFYYIGYKNEQIYSKKIGEMNLQVVTALAAAIDAKDNYTNGHSSRVAEYSRMIAARSGYSKPDQDDIYMMGLLHDVGKIGVPDEVINKPSKLTDEEYALIKKHPEIGGNILESIKERPSLAIGARWHHERYDGKGYPDGISGEEIPEEARIIAVADAYDAMTSRRSYRDVMSQDDVLKEFKKCKGAQFDPKFADVMIGIIEDDTDYDLKEKNQ